jgi:hypothetical protein
MKYSIYQINLTDEQYDDAVIVEVYRSVSFNCSVESVINAKPLYSKVAVIEAEDLEQVFTIGNIGPEHRIERLAPMHSVSVGDVVVDSNGLASFVAPLGFKQFGKQGEFCGV